MVPLRLEVMLNGRRLCVAGMDRQGVVMVTVIIMSRIFPPRESTGILLPMLIFGDLGTVLVYRRHARWPQVRRLLPPMILGVIAGFVLMSYIPDQRFSPVIGWPFCDEKISARRNDRRSCVSGGTCSVRVEPR